MVYIQDIAKTPDRNFTSHQVIFTTSDTGEAIKKMQSTSPLPIPRKGENVVLGESVVAEAESGAPKWDHRDEYPESDDLTFQVTAIEHEYAFLGPDDGMEEAYETGYAVFTEVFVEEVEPTHPV